MLFDYCIFFWYVGPHVCYTRVAFYISGSGNPSVEMCQLTAICVVYSNLRFKDGPKNEIKS